MNNPEKYIKYLRDNVVCPSCGSKLWRYSSEHNEFECLECWGTWIKHNKSIGELSQKLVKLCQLKRY